ncbi:FliH/SctL family protein [Saccharospirillum alexandrii]|uniref:FliH/SctL family protein n=1 Tax=Saccharospirillum alexandrii TaxID=2448477 RepID=UPI000FDC524A|nr:FliH/SctL family protein [Saccharospirillum alexandrii]
MMPNNAGGPTRSAAGSPKKGATGYASSGQDAPNVEPYQLPRWDAQGKPVPQPKGRQADTSTVEDVQPESLSPPTAEDIRQIHEDAYNEGFESGFEQGMKQGQATGQTEGYKAGYDSGEQEGLSAGHKAGMLSAQQAETERINAELAPLSELFDQIKAVLGQQTDDLETGLVALAVRIARNVIDAELTLKPEHIQGLVHAAVQALPNADERFTLEINPDDAAYVEPIAEPHWNLVPTPSISRGGCVIRTRFSYVDYTLEHRYRQQVSNLLAHAGLSEQLAAMESPWPLPPAEPDAEQATGAALDDAAPTGETQPEDDAGFAADDPTEPEADGSGDSTPQDVEADNEPDEAVDSAHVQDDRPESAIDDVDASVADSSEPAASGLDAVEEAGAELHEAVDSARVQDDMPGSAVDDVNASVEDSSEPAANELDAVKEAGTEPKQQASKEPDTAGADVQSEDKVPQAEQSEASGDDESPDQQQPLEPDGNEP